MHKSRLATVVIDCQTDQVDAAAQFWAAALGRTAEPLTDPAEPVYRNLPGPPEEITVVVQSVTHPNRFHIDIETDDIEAEVKRMESLGAKRVVFVRRWWVMESPFGQRFCIVRPTRPDFEANANTWRD